MIDLDKDKPEELIAITDKIDVVNVQKVYKVRYQDGQYDLLTSEGRSTITGDRVVIKKQKDGMLAKLLGFLFIALLSITISCGSDHDVNVDGGTTNNAEAVVEIIKTCDQVALRICKGPDMASKDKLECIKYACEFNASVEVLGMSDENIGSILDELGEQP